MLSSGEYKLVDDDAASTKKLYYIKLTDSAHRALNEYLEVMPQIQAKPSIEFNANEGKIFIPSGNKYDNSTVDFRFSVMNNISMAGPNGSFECLKKRRKSKKLVKMGRMEHRLVIQAKEDVYETTKNRMAAIEQEQRKNCTVQIDLPQKEKFKKPLFKRPFPAFKPGVPKVKKPLVEENIGNPRVMKKTMRDRIIHLLALRPHKKLEIFASLQKDGLKESDKAHVLKQLQEVSVFRDNMYTLLKHIWHEVQEDWDFYSSTERQSVMLNKEKITLLEKFPTINEIPAYPKIMSQQGAETFIPPMKRSRVSHFSQNSGRPSHSTVLSEKAVPSKRLSDKSVRTFSKTREPIQSPISVDSSGEASKEEVHIQTNNSLKLKAKINDPESKIADVTREKISSELFSESHTVAAKEYFKRRESAFSHIQKEVDVLPNKDDTSNMTYTTDCSAVDLQNEITPFLNAPAETPQPCIEPNPKGSESQYNTIEIIPTAKPQSSSSSKGSAHHTERQSHKISKVSKHHFKPMETIPQSYNSSEGLNTVNVTPVTQMSHGTSKEKEYSLKATVISPLRTVTENTANKQKSYNTIEENDYFMNTSVQNSSNGDDDVDMSKLAEEDLHKLLVRYSPIKDIEQRTRYKQNYIRYYDIFKGRVDTFKLMIEAQKGKEKDPRLEIESSYLGNFGRLLKHIKHLVKQFDASLSIVDN